MPDIEFRPSDQDLVFPSDSGYPTPAGYMKKLLDKKKNLRMCNFHIWTKELQLLFLFFKHHDKEGKRNVLEQSEI